MAEIKKRIAWKCPKCLDAGIDTIVDETCSKCGTKLTKSLPVAPGEPVRWSKEETPPAPTGIRAFVLEVQEKRSQLEAGIAELVKKFEAETGATIERIEIPTRLVHKGKTLIGVSVKGYYEVAGLELRDPPPGD